MFPAQRDPGHSFLDPLAGTTAAGTGSLRARTGRTLEEWVALVGATSLDAVDRKSVRTWLRGVHGVKQNTLHGRVGERLTPDGPGQATHEASLTGADELDDEVRALLVAAYEQNGRPGVARVRRRGP